MAEQNQLTDQQLKARNRRSAVIAILIVVVVASVYAVTVIKGPFFIVERSLTDT